METMMLTVDLYRLEELLTDEQRQLRNKVRTYVEETIVPNINPYWERAEFPRELAMGLRDLGIVGGPVQGYGCPGLDALSAGLVINELSRGDGSVCTFYGVQSGLTIGTINLLGSEEQRQRWIPGLAALDKIGAYGLTEPSHGSDAAHMLTTACRDGDSYILNGTKRWVGNASFADVLIIWARDDEDGYGGFVLEQPQQLDGVQIEDITGKITKRSVLNGHITLENVRIPVENRLENSRSFGDIAKTLTIGRCSVAWEAAGLSASCFDMALRHAQTREQFGRPIAGFQLIQQKLVDMAAEINQMYLLCFQLARLITADQLTPGIASMTKYNNARKARQIAQQAREILGGDGVLLENHIARLFTDVEAIYTYEGSSEINLLIAGREITGISAFV